MTVDLSTMRMKSEWERVVHALSVDRDLVRHYEDAALQKERLIRRELGLGTHTLHTYVAEVTETDIILTSKEQA